MKANGANKILVAYAPEEGAVRMPHWIDNTIIHIRYLKGVYSSEVCRMNPDGEDVKRLSHNEATDYYPKVSPDGAKVAFCSQTQNGQRQIWIMDVGGSNLRQIPETQSHSCDWSPDGDSIVYADARRDNGRLWIMNADGSSKSQLTFKYHFQH